VTTSSLTHPHEDTIRWYHDLEDFRPTSDYMRARYRDRGWDLSKGNPIQGWEPEYPDAPHHYRNAPAIHAPLVLQDIIDRFRRLSFLPVLDICLGVTTAMTGEVST
jgi:hypothetical protein